MVQSAECHHGSGTNPQGSLGTKGTPATISGYSGETLDLQWQFWKGYDPSRVHLANGSLTLAAHADSIQTTSPATRAAMHRSYTVEVEVEIAPGCEAGLLLFYDSNHFCGLRLTSDPHPKSQPRTTIVSATRATFRIVNKNQEVDFFYRVEDPSAAGKWIHVRGSLDVTCYQQNALGGFLDLRPALYACGAGSATFRNWVYNSKVLAS